MKCSAGVADPEKVPNNDITASTYYSSLYPYNGRLGSTTSWSVGKSTYQVYEFLTPTLQNTLFTYFLIVSQL